VIELLAVNRLCEPESEPGVHQRWYGTTAMDVVLGTDDAMAAKDRLYRALDKAIEVAGERVWKPIKIAKNPKRATAQDAADADYMEEVYALVREAGPAGAARDPNV
jgi:hypothetical protein